MRYIKKRYFVGDELGIVMYEDKRGFTLWLDGCGNGGFASIKSQVSLLNQKLKEIENKCREQGTSVTDNRLYMAAIKEGNIRYGKHGYEYKRGIFIKTPEGDLQKRVLNNDASKLNKSIPAIVKL